MHQDAERLRSEHAAAVDAVAGDDGASRPTPKPPPRASRKSSPPRRPAVGEDRVDLVRAAHGRGERDDARYAGTKPADLSFADGGSTSTAANSPPMANSAGSIVTSLSGLGKGPANNPADFQTRFPWNDRERHGRPRHVGVRDVHDAPVEWRFDICPNPKRRLVAVGRSGSRLETYRPQTQRPERRDGQTEPVHPGGRRRVRARQRSRVQGLDVDDGARKSPLRGHGDRFAVVVGGGFPHAASRVTAAASVCGTFTPSESASVTVNASVDPATPPA